MSILPDPKETNPKIKFRNIVFSLWLFISQCIGLISSVAYFLRFVSDDLESSLYALVQLSGYTCTAYTMAIGYIQRKCIEKLFLEFREVCEKCEYYRSLDLLTNYILAIRYGPYPSIHLEFLSKQIHRNSSKQQNNILNGLQKFYLITL